VACRRRLQPVEGFDGGADGGGKSDRLFGHGHIVVDGLGDADKGKFAPFAPAGPIFLGTRRRRCRSDR
jgi:hypothetical protein